MIKRLPFLCSILFILTIATLKSNAQSHIPNSIVNVGVGIGANYGIIGTKTVVGYKNSGLMLGLGYAIGGLPGYQIGGQLSIKWFYMNLSYGVVQTAKVNNDPTYSVKAGNIMVGGMIGLGQEKRTFIDLAIGHSFGAPPLVIYVPYASFEQDQNTVTFCLGIGYRFGTVKTKSE